MGSCKISFWFGEKETENRVSRDGTRVFNLRSREICQYINIAGGERILKKSREKKNHVCRESVDQKKKNEEGKKGGDRVVNKCKPDWG